jgi:hypothetical protein
MLITNFAAGELSETLFGRIDLPQYYQGVSRLENFDVIPTGGITRRNGTKRLTAMQEEGRIIPFILDRERHYLLYLMPGKIQVYYNGQPQGNPITNINGSPIYNEMSVIDEVQYAQNFETMVLVHPNRVPIVVKFINEQLYAFNFTVNYKVTIKTSEEGGVDESKYDEDDPIYKDNYYLQTENNYPSAVTFFNGRLIFAGTKRNPQRVFASGIVGEDGNYHFATYKLYLALQRIYITITGSIDADNTKTIILDRTDEGLKFTKPLETYFLDTPFYPPGTKIDSLQGSVLTVSGPATIQLPLDEAAQLMLTAFVEQFDEYEKYDETSEKIKFATFMTEQYDQVMGDNFVQNYVYFIIGACTIRIHTKFMNESDNGFTIVAKTLPEDAVRIYEENPSYFNDIINELVEQQTAYNPIHPPINVILYPDNILSAIVDLTFKCTHTMKLIFEGETYYGYAPDIKEKIEIRYADANHVYIPIYTEKVLEDRYPTPEDGFTFEIASDMSDSIRWIAQNKNLLLGTETAEWVIPAETTAVNVRAILNSRYGSDKIQATSVGDAMCFFQSGRKALVEYYIPQQDNNFRANNMAMMNPGMLHESRAFDFDFISAPYTKIFVSREDGVLVTLLYERNTGTFAWGRMITGGEIKSVATLPGDSGFDEVYLIVKRSGTFYLERLDERGERVYLDSNSPYTGSKSGYTGDAVVYDNKIGYPFTSRAKSMPVLANNQMKQNAIKSLQVRFRDSFMPRVRSEPNGVENTIPHRGTDGQGYSGIIQIPFPGVYDRDVTFEFFINDPRRCEILAVNAEAN